MIKQWSLLEYFHVISDPISWAERSWWLWLVCGFVAWLKLAGSSVPGPPSQNIDSMPELGVKTPSWIYTNNESGKKWEKERYFTVSVLWRQSLAALQWCHFDHNWVSSSSAVCNFAGESEAAVRELDL